MARLKTAPSRLQSPPQRVQQATGSWRTGKESSAARGYGYRWQQARKRFLAEHPLCEKCGPRGLVVAATVVDHIAPHHGDMQLFWDETNWQALCKPCHDGEKAREEAANGQRFQCLPGQ